MHTLSEIRRSLDDLTESAKNDIFPIIQVDDPKGGYFGVPRAVLSYVDFLGALYGGYHGETSGSHRLIATTQKAESFIEEVFGEVDQVYRENGKLLYRMYRHGTVHLYRPNILRRSDGRIIVWVSYKGTKNGEVKYEGRTLQVQHMIPIVKSQNEDILPVCINALYADLLNSIDLFYRKIEAELSRGQTHLQRNFSDVVDALMEPDETDLNWNTR